MQFCLPLATVRARNPLQQRGQPARQTAYGGVRGCKITSPLSSKAFERRGGRGPGRSDAVGGGRRRGRARQRSPPHGRPDAASAATSYSVRLLAGSRAASAAAEPLDSAGYRCVEPEMAAMRRRSARGRSREEQVQGLDPHERSRGVPTLRRSGGGSVGGRWWGGCSSGRR
jgi:hypothetical protein